MTKEFKIKTCEKILNLEQKAKAAWQEADALLLELTAAKLAKDSGFIIVDNFANKTTVFKTTAVKRYTLKKTYA